ncbi:MAG: hypothetical protein QXD77_03285 [Candidatus Aenigmatarchaeota archaeon]
MSDDLQNQPAFPTLVFMRGGASGMVVQSAAREEKGRRKLRLWLSLSPLVIRQYGLRTDSDGFFVADYEPDMLVKEDDNPQGPMWFMFSDIFGAPLLASSSKVAGDWNRKLQELANAKDEVRALNAALANARKRMFEMSDNLLMEVRRIRQLSGQDQVDAIQKLAEAFGKMALPKERT